MRQGETQAGGAVSELFLKKKNFKLTINAKTNNP